MADARTERIDAAAVTGLSERTIRYDSRFKRVYLTENRRGIRVGDIRNVLARTGASLVTQPSVLSTTSRGNEGDHAIPLHQNPERSVHHAAGAAATLLVSPCRLCVGCLVDRATNAPRLPSGLASGLSRPRMAGKPDVALQPPVPTRGLKT
jgi:hypothetical protein